MRLDRRVVREYFALGAGLGGFVWAVGLVFFFVYFSWHLSPWFYSLSWERESCIVESKEIERCYFACLRTNSVESCCRARFDVQISDSRYAAYTSPDTEYTTQDAAAYDLEQYDVSVRLLSHLISSSASLSLCFCCGCREFAFCHYH